MSDPSGPANLIRKFKVQTPAGTGSEYSVVLDSNGLESAVINVETPQAEIVLTISLSPTNSPPGGVTSGSTGIHIDVLVQPGK